MIKIESGKWYKTKDGFIVGPMKIKDGSFWAPQNGYYAADGTYPMQKDGLFDIIEEWTDATPEKPAPINIVTRRKIVHGSYGIVNVDEYDRVSINFGLHTPEELREAAHILNQIAEWISDNEKQI